MIGLKECAWEHVDDSVLIVCDPSTVIELGDADGTLATLLTVLSEHPGDVEHLRKHLAHAGLTVNEDELRNALAALDGLRLLVDRSRHAGASRDEAGRYASNLAFFDLYASLNATDRDLQARLTDAHVLQLGTGGLGSNVLQSLAGLGVGRLTLVDADLVEPRNLARQFLYREDDLGVPKVERAAAWIRAFNSDIDVSAVRRWISGPDDLSDLLAGVDLVVSGIDQPNDIDQWVNEACVPAGIPWVRGGMTGSRLIYFSVQPGASACYACRIAAYGNGIDRAPTTLSDRQAVAQRLSAAVPRVNRAAGPAAALIGSLVAFEAMRYLTGYEPPFGAGSDVLVEVTGGCAQRREEWPRDPGCPVCARAGSRATAAR